AVVGADQFSAGPYVRVHPIHVAIGIAGRLYDLISILVEDVIRFADRCAEAVCAGIATPSRNGTLGDAASLCVVDVAGHDDDTVNSGSFHRADLTVSVIE